MADIDFSYQRSQYDVSWDFILFGGPRQGGVLHYDKGDFKRWMEENYQISSLMYVDRTLSPLPHYSFSLLYSHENHLKLPYPSPTAEIEVEGQYYDDEDGNIEFEVATPRFVVGFIRNFLKSFPRNHDIITVTHELSYARFDASLSDEDAMNRMMSDDEDLMRELGVID